MTKFLQKNRLAVLVALSMLAPSSCVKMDKTLGEDFIPPNQQLQVKLRDATGFFTMETVSLDSMSTSSFGTALLGRMNDPRMGKTTAGFVVQLLPATYSHTFEAGVTGFDSVYLILGFPSTYGSDQTPMDVDVYELNTDISVDSAYYGAPSVVERISKPTNLAPDIDSVTAASASVRIRLANEENLFGRLFHTTSADSFLTYFKGLYVKVPDGTGGSIKSVSVVNTSNEYATSALVAYYHYPYTYTDDNGNEVTRDSVESFSFHSFNTTPRFNVFKHENNHLKGGATADTLYMQGLAGVATKMTINRDSVEAWTGTGSGKKRYAISRAELTLPVADESDYAALNLYSTQLQCITEASSRSSGKYTAIWDMYATDGSFNSAFDGALNRSLMQYSINITRYFNGVVNGSMSPLIIIPYSYTSDARSVLIANSGSKKPQLKLTYVEIKTD
ncbi:MAG: DUF4270 domain-containing protein [Prevotellaceae bacterium]|jgi:hypothetical protein|nr:DUF4270 domain-containing protein [Prevotellaceae bacterium]